jgi:hypothetical protein
MGHLDRALADLSELRTFRLQSEHRAGLLWRDLVLERLRTRSLRPLDVEEHALMTAVATADQQIAQILKDL